MLSAFQERRKPQNVKLLDFQLVSNGNPVYDLCYCLYSGSSEETLGNLDDYLQIYHSSLTDTLKEFGLDSEQMYPWSKFKEEWKNFSKLGFFFGVLVWRTKLVDKNHIPDLTVEEGNIKVSDDLKDIYKKRVRELIIHMYNNDLL